MFFLLPPVVRDDSSLRTPSAASSSSAFRSSSSSSSSSLLSLTSSPFDASISQVTAELMSPQTYQRSLDTGVASKFRNTASFLDTGAEFGAKEILESLQAEVCDLFQMGEDICSGTLSSDVKSQLLQSLCKEQAQTFCKDSASVERFFISLVGQAPEHWHRSIMIDRMMADRRIDRSRERDRILWGLIPSPYSNLPPTVRDAPKLFKESVEIDTIFDIVKKELTRNPLMFLMGKDYATRVICESNLWEPTLTAAEKVRSTDPVFTLKCFI